MVADDMIDIDADNRIRQRSSSNQSSGWSDGSIGRANLKAWNGDMVGVQACWAINFSVPIRIFYASDETTFEEYLWFAQDDTWAWQRSWKGYSGTAGVACDHQGDSFYRYVGMVNLQDQLEFWYQVKGGDDLSADWLKCECDHIKASAGDTDVFSQLATRSIRYILLRRYPSSSRQPYGKNI